MNIYLLVLYLDPVVALVSRDDWLLYSTSAVQYNWLADYPGEIASTQIQKYQEVLVSELLY